ncbi:MAG: DUF4433 domain-containing protein [Candidatus Paceibacterota bacterium]
MTTTGNIPSTVYLYRIIHVDNLPFILDEQELRCPNHPDCDPNYLGIGDITLIQSRGSKVIPLQPGETFRDYISFYFGPRSPMLYEIKHGFNNVTKRNQGEIIYLIATVDSILNQNCDYVFFDGHGYHNFSGCYKDLKDLKQVDWKIVKAKYWDNTESDPDRKRRKQAEFLVYKSLPWSAIQSICVYNDKSQQYVQNMLNSRNISCTVITKTDYYY